MSEHQSLRGPSNRPAASADGREGGCQTAPSADSPVFKSAFRDRLALAGRGHVVRVRPSTRREREKAGLAPEASARAVVLSLCDGMLTALAADRPLEGDVSAAAGVLATYWQRPVDEVQAAATSFPMIDEAALDELAHIAMAVPSSCASCHCGRRYGPLLVALAQAVAKAHSRPWTLAGLDRASDDMVGGVPVWISEDARRVADAIRIIIRAGGLLPWPP